jgi:hypothetical protein
VTKGMKMICELGPVKDLQASGIFLIPSDFKIRGIIKYSTHFITG